MGISGTEAIRTQTQNCTIPAFNILTFFVTVPSRHPSSVVFLLPFLFLFKKSERVLCSNPSPFFLFLFFLNCTIPSLNILTHFVSVTSPPLVDYFNCTIPALPIECLTL